MSDNVEDLQGEPVKYEQSAEKQFRLVFRENRKFELTIKGTTYFFDPHGNQIVSDSVVNAMTEHEKSFFNVEAL